MGRRVDVYIGRRAGSGDDAAGSAWWRMQTASCVRAGMEVRVEALGRAMCREVTPKLAVKKIRVKELRGE